MNNKSQSDREEDEYVSIEAAPIRIKEHVEPI